MRAMIKRFDSKVVVENIDGGLSNLQDIVGGFIEVPYIGKEFSNKGIDVIVNDSGMIDGLDASIILLDESGVVGALFGQVIFVSHDKAEFCDLTDEQIDFLNSRMTIVMDSEGKIYEALYI